MKITFNANKPDDCFGCKFKIRGSLCDNCLVLNKSMRFGSLKRGQRLDGCPFDQEKIKEAK